MLEVFELTEQHILLLQHFYVNWQDDETGAPEIDPKRPYGNSSVAEDVANILGIDLTKISSKKKYEEGCNKLLVLHRETEIALQIVLCCKTFEPGKFCRSNRYESTSWKRVPTV